MNRIVNRPIVGGLDIFVIIGQSNAVGLATISEAESAILNWSPDERSMIWNQSLFQTEPLDIGTNNQLGCPDAPAGTDFGIEMPISVGQAEQGRRTLIIKSATYGSSLYSDWDPFTGTNDYETAWTAVASAKSILGGKYETRWNFMWLQGEEDAKGTYGGGVEFYYQAYLTQLITGMRFFCGDAAAPFVCAKLSALDLFTDPILFPDMDLVNTAMDNVAALDSNVYAVPSTLWDRKTDVVHFDAVGIVEAGDDMLAAIT